APVINDSYNYRLLYLDSGINAYDPLPGSRDLYASTWPRSGPRPQDDSGMKIVSLTQRLLFVIGVLLLGIYVGAQIHRTITSRAELLRFEKLQQDSRAEKPENWWLASEHNIDFSEWSQKRIEAYRTSLAEHFNAPLAVLRIAKVHLEVPVLEGTDDLTLNRGV